METAVRLRLILLFLATAIATAALVVFAFRYVEPAPWSPPPDVEHADPDVTKRFQEELR